METPPVTHEVGPQPGTIWVPSIMCEGCRVPVEGATKEALPDADFTLHVRGNEKSKIIFRNPLSDVERQTLLAAIDDIGHKAQEKVPDVFRQSAGITPATPLTQNPPFPDDSLEVPSRCQRVIRAFKR